MKPLCFAACIGLCACLGLGLSACNESDDEQEVVTNAATTSQTHRSSPKPASTNTAPDTPVDPLAGLCLPAWSPAPDEIGTLTDSSNTIVVTSEVIPFPDGSSWTNLYEEVSDYTSQTLTFADGTIFLHNRAYESFYTKTMTSEVMVADGNTDETLTAPDGAICAATEVISTVPGSSPATQFTAHVECPGGALTVIDRATFDLIKAKLGL
ncbi:MAG TPA: hypothetical protein DCZ95_03835 [Verrucomicrobia bacterium]|nr:MAG: hypothetical protein A2X46_02485 [Lentisphaerae bacterium GWF2_57_35]HBA83205.1 hypothetical protein [Verrucomicrobiota bacterium]